MLEAIKNFLSSIPAGFEAAIEHGRFYAVLVGWAVGIGVTQWVKLWPIYPTNKWAIRSLAVPIGAAVTFFAWPVHTWNAIRVCTALAAGVSTPWVYQLTTMLLYKYFPKLEKIISADPAPKP